MTLERIIYTLELKVGPHHKSLLKQKLNQYRDRLTSEVKDRPFKSVEEIDRILKSSQTFYSLSVLEELLRNKRINVVDTRSKLIRKLGTSFSPESFNAACLIVDRYSKNKKDLAESLHK